MQQRKAYFNSIGEIFGLDLCGAYFRNGPNPVFKPGNRYHPFDGDGMVHGVYFRDGAASYRNRYIATAALTAERLHRRAIWPGVMGPFDFSLPHFPIKDTSNTDIFCYNGTLMSLWYNAGEPYKLDAHSLETIGPYQLKGRSQRRMSAHSKVDWATDELLFFDYGDEPPYMTYGVAAADGRLIHEVAIDLPGPTTSILPPTTPFYTICHFLMILMCCATTCEC
jgi:carotenoid cleavage dioxygenase